MFEKQIVKKISKIYKFSFEKSHNQSHKKKSQIKNAENAY